MVNDLPLGCDCADAIHYLPNCFIGKDESVIKIKNAICDYKRVTDCGCTRVITLLTARSRRGAGLESLYTAH